jgi:UDP-GlcNAc:undecaprenyl-phosphate GlcNAc-1-phosphate transferase
MMNPWLTTMLIFSAFFIVAVLISVIATAWARRLAKRLEIFDKPDKRKLHAEPVPYLGGVALYVAFLLYALLARRFIPESYPEWFPAVIVASGLLVAAGVYDDVKGLSAWIKFPIQIAAALILYYFTDINIARVAHPFQEGWIWFGPLTVVFTVIWVVGLINAINLIDGLDGLAAGVVAISSSFMFIMMVLRGEPSSGLLALGLFGVCFGFLRYNFAPARIFMGDAGSMFLGFMLAVFSMTQTLKGTAVVTLLFPLLILGIPILDTAMAFLRRLSEGKHPFQGDARHIHHRFLAIGLTDTQAVLVIYFFCIALGLFALVMMRLTPAYRVLTLGLLVCLITFVILAMRYIEQQFISVLEEVKSYKEWVRYYNIQNGNRSNPLASQQGEEAATSAPDPGLDDDRRHYNPPVITHTLIDKLTGAEEQRMEKILILCSETSRPRVKAMITHLGHQAVAVDSAENLEDLIKQGVAGVIVLEESALEGEISNLVVRIRLLSPESTILVLSGSSENQETLGLLRLGAYGILPARASDGVLELMMFHAMENRFRARRLKFLHLVFWMLIFSIPIWVIIGRFIAMGAFY